MLKETQRSPRTSKTEGYGENVQYTPANAALFAKMQYDHNMALANIVTETQADRASIALLIKTIVELSTQVFTLTAKLATTQSENVCLKISGHRSSSADHRHCSANIQAPSNQNPLYDRNVYSRSGGEFDHNKYWSSYGFKVEDFHTSVSCRYPVDGHKKLATRLETKGGNTWNKDCINGGQEWGGDGLYNSIVDINKNCINYIN